MDGRYVKGAGCYQIRKASDMIFARGQYRYSIDKLNIEVVCVLLCRYAAYNHSTFSELTVYK